MATGASALHGSAVYKERDVVPARPCRGRRPSSPSELTFLWQNLQREVRDPHGPGSAEYPRQDPGAACRCARRAPPIDRPLIYLLGAAECGVDKFTDVVHLIFVGDPGLASLAVLFAISSLVKTGGTPR